MKLVVTAGFNQSLHTIGLLNVLHREGHEIGGVVIVKTFQIKRIKRYLRQYGFETMKNKFKTFILRSENNALSNETKYVKDFLKKNNITHTSITQFCKEKKIPFKFVNSLNDSDSVDFAKSSSPELIVYSGGGILRNNIIDVPSIGVLNAHSGLLPFFRGMNVIEWALLYDVKPHTTIHFINRGIDTGEILYTEEIPFGEKLDLYDYRGLGAVHELELLLKVLNNFDHYYESRQPQSKAQGKQFFIMHPFLKEILNKKLKKGGRAVLAGFSEKAFFE